jgi:hypothetical protein
VGDVNGRRPVGTPPSRVRIARMLKAEAEGREPDRDRMYRRIQAALDEPVLAPERRFGWGDAAKAAAVAAVAAAVVFAATELGDRTTSPAPGQSAAAPAPVERTPSDATPTAIGSATVTTAPTPTVPPTTTPPPSPTTSRPHKPPAKTDKPPAPPKAPVPDVSASIVSWGWGSGIGLTAQSNRDWLVAGARQDGRVIRRKESRPSLGAPEVVAGAAAIDGGPYVVNWSGGTPEQDRQGVWTWLTARNHGSIRLTVPAGDQAQTVRLYVGAFDGNAALTARFRSDGEVAARVDVPGTGASVVTLRIQGGRAGDTLAVDLTDRGPGVVGLSVATLD